MLLAQTLEVRAMPLIVLPVSALLLLFGWAGAFVLLNPSTVDPAIRWGGLPMLLRFWHEGIGQFTTTSGTGSTYKLTITVYGTWAFLGRTQQMTLTASTSVQFETS